PNSEVKRSIADGSVGFPHVRVGQCQAVIQALSMIIYVRGFFILVVKYIIILLSFMLYSQLFLKVDKSN
ncbi:MAG: hypothetical protein WAQ53_18525, partial [Thiofilum sp.]